MKIVRFKNLKYIPASHEDLNDPGVFKKVLFTFKDIIKGQIMMINWTLLPKGKSFKAHYHEDMDEVFILLKGKAKMRVEDEEEVMEKGDGIIVPMKNVHVMSNIGSEDVEYIVLGVALEKGGKTVKV